MAEGSGRSATPARIHWALRLADAFPFAPGWLAALITAAGLAVFASLSWSLGWVEGFRFQGEPFWRTLQFRLELLNAVVLGVLPVAMAVLLRGARRDLRDLAPALELSPSGLEQEQGAITRFATGALLAVSLAGSLGGAAIALDPFPAEEKARRAGGARHLHRKAIESEVKVMGHTPGNRRQSRFSAFAQPHEIEPLLQRIWHAYPRESALVASDDQTPGG